MADLKIFVIGSAPDCDIVVNDPHVSGHHCKLTYDRGGYLVEDLQSSNGTFVNGVRITEEMIVTKGDPITLGRSFAMPWPNGSEIGNALETRDGTSAAPATSPAKKAPAAAPPRPAEAKVPTPVEKTSSVEKPSSKPSPPPVPEAPPAASPPAASQPSSAPRTPPLPKSPPVPPPSRVDETEAAAGDVAADSEPPRKDSKPTANVKTGSRTIAPGDMTIGDDEELAEGASIPDPRQPAEGPSVPPVKSSPPVKASSPVKPTPVKPTAAKGAAPIKASKPESPKPSQKPAPKPSVVPQPARGNKPKPSVGPPPPPSPPQPGARFTDPRALDPDSRGSSRALVIAAAASVAVVGLMIVGFVFFNPGEDTSPGAVPQGDPPVTPTTPGGTDQTVGTRTGDDPVTPPGPVVKPEPRTEPELAVVWIGYEVGGSESRLATGFAISPTEVVTAGWHGVWMNPAQDDPDFTMLAGVGSQSARVRRISAIPIGGDDYGLLRLEIEPLAKIEPVDPATVGDPPKPDTPIQWITWDEWIGDTVPIRRDARFLEPIEKGVSWKIAFEGLGMGFPSKYGGAPIVIDNRVVGILSLDVGGEPRVLSLGPALPK